MRAKELEKVLRQRSREMDPRTWEWYQALVIRFCIIEFENPFIAVGQDGSLIELGSRGREKLEITNLGNIREVLL